MITWGESVVAIWHTSELRLDDCKGRLDCVQPPWGNFYEAGDGAGIEAPPIRPTPRRWWIYVVNGYLVGLNCKYQSIDKDVSKMIQSGLDDVDIRLKVVFFRTERGSEPVRE
jgi:hypothetical protein